MPSFSTFLCFFNFYNAKLATYSEILNMSGKKILIICKKTYKSLVCGLLTFHLSSILAFFRNFLITEQLPQNKSTKAAQLFISFNMIGCVSLTNLCKIPYSHNIHSSVLPPFQHFLHPQCNQQYPGRKAANVYGLFHCLLYKMSYITKDTTAR